jgi:hypothetical protein
MTRSVDRLGRSLARSRRRSPGKKDLQKPMKRTVGALRQKALILGLSLSHRRWIPGMCVSFQRDIWDVIGPGDRGGAPADVNRRQSAVLPRARFQVAAEAESGWRASGGQSPGPQLKRESVRAQFGHTAPTLGV